MLELDFEEENSPTFNPNEIKKEEDKNIKDDQENKNNIDLKIDQDSKDDDLSQLSPELKLLKKSTTVQIKDAEVNRVIN